MAECLSSLIMSQTERGELKGLKFHDGMTPQTHQQFVNDTMLMGHPSIQEAQSFKKILNLFAKALGLDVDPNKSQVLFVNTALATQRNILRILGFLKGYFPSKYPGIPLAVGRLQKMSWQ